MQSKAVSPLLLLVVTALFIGLLAPTGQAQTLSATATVMIQDAPTNPADPKATHKIGCTDILLRSATVDLKTFKGKNTLITGNLVIGLGYITIDVTKAESAPVATSAFALFGYKPGATVTVTTSAPVGSVVVLFFGVKPGFLPLGQYGSFMMDFTSSFLWSFDLSIGVAVKFLKIPNDPIFSGLNVLFQTGYLQVTPSISGGMLNPTCFQIK